MRLALFTVVLSACALAPSQLPAQGADAFPLRRGLLRFEVGSTYAAWEGIRVGSGDAVGIGATASVPLNSANFAPLRTAEVELNRFFRATDQPGGGIPVANAEVLTLGTLHVGASAERERVPIRLSLAVTNRLSVAAAAVVSRGRVHVQRLSFQGGTVGLNPNPESNAAALAAIEPSYGTLGASPFLPLADSPLGEALRARVAARGGTLVLPDSAASADQFRALISLGPERRWRAESAQFGVRMQLLGADDSTAAPDGIRAAISVRGSVPLARGLDQGPFLVEIPAGATPEVIGSTVADFGLSERFWLSAGARYTVRAGGTITRRVSADLFPADSTLRDVRVDPGDELVLELTPRLQFTDEISFGLLYTYGRQTADSAGEGAEPLSGDRSTQLLGLGARFSTFPAWLRGGSTIPVEAELRAQAVVAGSGGIADATLLELRGRLYLRLWGG